METASLTEIKKELKLLSPQQLQDIVVRLVKYKKENKELLHYLLFEAFNQQEFIRGIKEEIDEQFLHMRYTSPYLAKKTLRKALRTTKKYIRFSGSREFELELLIYFCLKIRSSAISLNAHRTIMNLYLTQVKRIKKIHSMLHEDLRSDFEEDISKL